MRHFFARNLEHPAIPLFCMLLTGICVAATFPFQASFWIDETLTAWVTAGTLQQTIERATTYQGQPPFYFVCSRALQQLAGTSEIVLRLPSLLAAVFVLLLTWRLAASYCHRGAAWFAPLFLIATDEFQKFALSARPYMPAVLMALLALFWIIRTRERQSFLLFSLATLSFVLSVYLHPVFLAFAPVLVIFALYESVDIRSGLKNVLGSGLLLAAAITPLAWQMLSLGARRESLFFARIPDITALLKTITPSFPVVAFLTACICTAIFFKSFRYKWQQRHSSILLLFFIWLISGPLLYFVHARLTGDSLFLPRIMFWRLPALACLTALLISNIQPVLVRNFAIILFSVLTISGYSIRPWHLENWREAVAASTQDADTRVALFSGLIELESLDWVTDRKHRSYLSAPFSVYAPGFKNVLLLPRNPHDPAARRYIEEQVLPALEGGDQLIIYLTFRHAEPKYLVHEKLIELLEQHGFTLTPLVDAGLVRRYAISQ